MSLKATFEEILDILEPVSKLTEAQRQRFRILQRKLSYQLEGRYKHVKECDELLDALQERDKYKCLAEENAGDLMVTCRQLDAAQTELEKMRTRLEDAERLLCECSKEYIELQENVEKLTARLKEKIPEEDCIPPYYAEQETLH